MPTAAVLSYGGQKLEPYYKPEMAMCENVKLPASVSYARGTVLGELTGTNERQSVTVTGGPTGGTFTLTYSGQTTAAIAYNANADEVRTALEALSTIGDGNVAVSGGPGPGAPFYVDFVGTLAGTNAAAMTASGASLTGGTTPGVTIATVTGGAAGTSGTWKAYDNDNTDGSGTPRGILVYDCQTDASGNIIYSATSGATGGEYGETHLYAPVYVAGYFACADLTGLDSRAVAALGRLLHGDIATGVLAVGV